MAEVDESTPPSWAEDLASVIKTAEKRDETVDASWSYHAVEFAKAFGEMCVEFGRGVRDVVKQSSVVRELEDSIVVRKLRGPCRKTVAKANQYFLPEDRDPIHAWGVIFSVWIVAFAGGGVYMFCPLLKKVRIHPLSATRVLLPDGRHLAYQEQGVPADRARFSMITPHAFLSSRLAGIPGIKDSLLEEFGVRLVSYDLPGFGESDPHPERKLESSALDMLHLSYAVNVTEKFWVLGYSSGSMHAWAALRYIPDRIAGAIMVAPLVNPYEPSMNKQERRRIWKKWTTWKQFMYHLARKFPAILPYFYRRSFLSGDHGPIDKWLSLSLGRRDRALIEHQMFEEFWQRDVEESVRQLNARPFVEEAVLQVSNWGFRLADLKARKARRKNGVIPWLKSLYGQTEESLTGFLGSVHLWQGMDDGVVPAAMSDFVQRVLPDVVAHKLLYDGHFTYFYFCDECHRQIFSTVFGNPEGPLTQEADNDEDINKESLCHELYDADNITSLVEQI